MVCEKGCLKVWLNGEFSLDLTMTVKTHNKPPKSSPVRVRRGKPITTYGKRMIRSSLFYLEREHKKEKLSFLTCTLPSESKRVMERIVTKWSEVTRQMKQALERELERAGIKAEVVLVTEIQEKRYNETEEIAPHLHIVFQGKKSRYDQWAITKERARELWENVLSAVGKKKISAPRGTSIQPIRKSVENYLSKYMSKGGKVVQEIIGKGDKDKLPPSWWGMTRSLSKIVRNAIRETRQSKDELLHVLYKNRYRLKADGHLQYFYITELERGMKSNTDDEDLVIDYSKLPGGDDAEFGQVPVNMVGKFAKPEIAEWFL